jgi:hypothetical protein
MRREVAAMLTLTGMARRNSEGPTPENVGALSDAGRGKLVNLSHIKARQELAFLSGLITPVQQSHTSVLNLIIRLFCADIHQKGVHTWSVITAKPKPRSMVKTAKAIGGINAIPA